MLKVTIIIGIVVAALTAGWQVGQPFQTNNQADNQRCLSAQQERAQYERNSSVNALSECSANSDIVQWNEWLSGRSISTQFHFLDLIELLFGDKPQNQKERHSPSSKF